MTERNDTGGLATVLSLLGVCGAGGEPGENQADMFEAETPGPVEPVKGKSGPQGGRPVGARNRSTEEWVKFLLGRGRAPATVLQDIYSRPWQELHAELQAAADEHEWTSSERLSGEGHGRTRQKILINPLDVIRLQNQCAMALLPYVHKKQPVAIETDKGRRGLIMLDPGEFEDIDGMALPLPREAQENQTVGADDGRQSDDD